jgi:hypothetical protein
MMDVPDRMKGLGFSDEFLATRRARFLPEADRWAVQTIGCGVLFVMAFWSGPARLAFGALKKILAETDPHGRLELVVADTDGCPELYHLPEFRGQLAGAGETARVIDGRVVSTALRPTAEALKSNTLDLLSKCGAQRTQKETS